MLPMHLSSIVFMSQGPRSGCTEQENCWHEQTEWKDRRDHRWRYRHRPRRSKALHRGRRLRLYLRPPAGSARRRCGRPRAQCPRGEGLGLRSGRPRPTLRGGEGRARSPRDIVFANAGAGSQLALGKITAEHIDDHFDTNVKGTIFTVQKALPLMGEGGSIILTGSSAGTTGAPGMSAYSASKAAVRNLARTWAEDLKGTGIRVNVLSPGGTATDLAKAAHCRLARAV